MKGFCWKTGRLEVPWSPSKKEDDFGKGANQVDKLRGNFPNGNRRPEPLPNGNFRSIIGNLVGGFHPSEKYESKWESSPNRGENKKYLKPPPSR